MSNNIKFLPYVTEDLSVSTETPPFEFCPEIELINYNPLLGLEVAQKFSHSLPYDRHKILGTISSTDYQDAIDLAGIPGSLSSNFVSVYIVETNAYPSGLPIGTPIYVPAVSVVGGVEFTYEFRPEPNWTTKFINVVLLFNHNGQDDYVVVPVSVKMAPYNKTATNISLVVDPQGNKVYQNGANATELCIGDPVYIEFETGILEDWYPPTIIHERGGLFQGEYNTYGSADPANLPLLTDPPVDEFTYTVDTYNKFRVDLDPGGIESGDCFYFLFKKVDATLGCTDEFCVDLSTVISGDVNRYLQVDWVSDLLATAQYDFAFFYQDESYNYQTVVWSSTDASGSYTSAINIQMPQAVTLTITVSLANGCVYTYSWTFTAQVGIASTTQYCTA